MKRTLAALALLVSLASGAALGQGQLTVELPELRHTEPAPLVLEPGQCGSTVVTLVNTGNESASLRLGTMQVVRLGQERPEVTARVQPPLATLMPGGAIDITIEACVFPSAQDGATNVTIDVSAAQGVPIGTIPVEVRVRAASEATLPTGALVALALAGGAVAVWGAFRRTEWLRYAALVAASPLYTRLARSTLLEQERRDAIYRIVQQEPGIHFSAILERTGLPNGVLVHHLRTLERHHLITSRRDGVLRRFAASMGEMPAPAPRPVTPMQARVLELLRDGPMTQPEIARALGLTQQGANRHVKALERRGLLQIRYADGQWRCHATPHNAPSPIDA